MQVKKIFPSSSGFSTGSNYDVEYNGSCYRYIVASLDAPKKDIDPIYAQVGAIHEDAHAIALGALVDVREKPIKKDYGDGIEYSGRMDFVLKDGSIHETKASISKTVLYSTIRKKQVKLSHLSQLVSYLIHTGTDTGKIVVGYYKQQKDGTLTYQEGTDFDVKVDVKGDIYVSGVKYQYNIGDAIRYLLVLVDVLKTEKIANRPIVLDQWKNPCKFCPLSSLCDEYDVTNNEVEFKSKAKEVLTLEAKK